MRFEYESDEFEGELDEHFLASYASGRSTVPMFDETSGAANEDEDDEHLYWLERQLGLHQAAEPEETAEFWATDEDVADTVQEPAQEEPVRNVRGMRRFQRHSKVDGKRQEAIEARKSLTYYLHTDLRDQLKELAKANKMMRREVVITALENLLADGNPQINMLPDKAGFKSRKFLWDEVPAELWQRVDALCWGEDGVKVLHHYMIVEVALRRYIEENTTHGTGR